MTRRELIDTLELMPELPICCRVADGVNSGEYAWDKAEVEKVAVETHFNDRNGGIYDSVDELADFYDCDGMERKEADKKAAEDWKEAVQYIVLYINM